MGSGAGSLSELDRDGSHGAGPSGERRYDSFVVRLWREVGSRRLLRVEVEHTQSDGVASARGVEIDWIGARIADLLEEP